MQNIKALIYNLHVVQVDFLTALKFLADFYEEFREFIIHFNFD